MPEANRFDSGWLKGSANLPFTQQRGSCPRIHISDFRDLGLNIGGKKMAAGSSVLLVDDDESVLNGLRLVLEVLGFEVHLAANAEEALVLLDTVKLDAIVSDEQMPGICGSELLVYARKKCPHVIRVMLTGKSTAQSVQRAVKDGGALCYLEKPCPAAAVANVLRRELLRRTLGAGRNPKGGMTSVQADKVMSKVLSKRQG